MTSTKPVSPKKRYALRLVELAKQDPQVGTLYPNKSLFEKAKGKELPLDQTIDIFLDGYADRPALGERNYEVITDVQGASSRSYQPCYKTITYRELRRRTRAVAMAWRQDTHRVAPEDFVMIMGFADIDFTTLDMACAYAKAITVPVQSNTSGADLNEIVENIKPTAIAATLADLEVAAQLVINSPYVRQLIVFNYDPEVTAERSIVNKVSNTLKDQNKPIPLISIDELITHGQDKEWSWLPNQSDHREQCVAIFHSSGSTGKPKGAIMPEKALIDNWIGRPGSLPRITVHLAPMNHLMGRNNVYTCLSYGGTGYFTLEPDLSSLLEDIRIARPIFLSLFPRIFELIYQFYQNEVSRRLRQTGKDRIEIENEVKTEMRHSFLGDRLLCVVFGSAPTALRMQQFMNECFDILMVEGYGNTESGTGAITLDNKIDRSNVLDYKLIDVPELGYFTSDLPYPRGELLVKTVKGIRGYYNQPETTKNLFDPDGYMCTGDIVEQRSSDEVWVVDRRKDVLKLSQGEYVAVGTLGTIYEAGSPLIKQIYVYGNSKRSYLLAVVVLEKEILEQRLGTDPKDADIKMLIRDEFNKVALKDQLKPFEIPRDVILEYNTFTQDNGLLSSVRKKLRPALKRKYGPLLEDLYESHSNDQNNRIAELKSGQSELNTLEKLTLLIEDQLNIKLTNPQEPRTFTQLGGDSLGASLFSLSIEEIFDVSIPADAILAPSASLSSWAQLIQDAQRKDHDDRPNFNKIHGKGAKTVTAEDLQLAQFIPVDVLSKASNISYAPTTPQCVLMTGANGFLGHIVCLEWLKILANRGGQLICIIRASDDDAAFKKLQQEYIGLDPQLEKTFTSLAADHLVVKAGDISQSLFGWTSEVFNNVASQVDRICHVAALVNHRLSYKHLFGPNVNGTAEIIRLSLTNRLKPIDFISSVGVFMLLDERWSYKEDTPFIKEIELSDAYAAGYATSKWAGETLLNKMHKRFGNEVNVFRCDMILPDQVYKGQANTSDMLTRLLYSLIKTGIAPRSFYKNRTNGQRKSSHYTGVPVDVLAKAITGVHTRSQGGHTTYHSLNYLDDNISLDNFVDWITSAGYPIARMKDYERWHQHMETKLKALPEAERQQSVLHLLMAYQYQQYGGASKTDCSNFKHLVENIETLGSIPHLSENYLHKYLTDMAHVGLIDQPKYVAPSNTYITSKTQSMQVQAYAAQEAGATLTPYQYELSTLGPEEVDVKVSYCGICHSDLSMINNEWRNSHYPLIPGHEVVGEVVGVGVAVKNVKIGDKVGVGWFAHSCMSCYQCMDGSHHLCPERKPTIVPSNGGFADYVRSHWAWAIPLPDGIDMSKAGPLLCGGITVFNPIISAGVLPTDKVGVIGIGGLGHLAVKFLKHWGCEVVAFSSSENKREQILNMGASRVVNSRSRDDLKTVRNQLDFIINTTNVTLDWNSYLKALAPKGRFFNVGMVLEPMAISGGQLINGEKVVSGSPVGSPQLVSKMLDFCVRHDIYPDVEEFAMSDVNDAIAHLDAGKARYRIVLKN